MTTNAATVSRQLGAAGYTTIAPEDQFRREGTYVEKSSRDAVKVGFSHHVITARVRRYADEIAGVLRKLGYAVEVRDVPADHYLALYVKKGS